MVPMLAAKISPQQAKDVISTISPSFNQIYSSSILDIPGQLKLVKKFELCGNGICRIRYYITDTISKNCENTRTFLKSAFSIPSNHIIWEPI